VNIFDLFLRSTASANRVGMGGVHVIEQSVQPIAFACPRFDHVLLIGNNDRHLTSFNFMVRHNMTIHGI
jgi:hypothetical protein